ncbi:MAG TPA: hypothetical protein VHW66_20460 [Stellaceae bacterium]|nr:hypothetical protein [Stellaceae bacterium]
MGSRKLGIGRLICPPSPGVASAWGLLVAPARVDRVATVGFRLDTGDLAAFERAFQSLEDEAKRVVAATGLPVDAAVIERLGDGRCVGQEVLWSPSRNPASLPARECRKKV